MPGSVAYCSTMRSAGASASRPTASSTSATDAVAVVEYCGSSGSTSTRAQPRDRSSSIAAARQSGGEHVSTPATHAQLVCSLLPENKKNNQTLKSTTVSETT